MAECCCLHLNQAVLFYFAGASRYSPPEYPFAMNNAYPGKMCTPQASWQNEEDNRSRSTSPQSQGLCSTTTGSNGSVAPPLSHPPIHNTVTTYSMPGSYLASVVPALHGYSQMHCGSYSPTESLYPRTDHFIRSPYPPMHNSWQADGSYSYH